MKHSKKKKNTIEEIQTENIICNFETDFTT